MIDLNLSPSAKLSVFWIINPKVLLHSEPNIGFYFYCKFYTFRIILVFTVLMFYPEINKPYV